MGTGATLGYLHTAMSAVGSKDSTTSNGDCDDHGDSERKVRLNNRLLLN